MSKFDVSFAVRQSKSFLNSSLSRRSNAELPFVSEEDIVGSQLLLDTCVYIDQLHGKLPDIVKRMIDSRHNAHSAVCIQELVHTIGVLDPSDLRTPSVISTITTLINSMPEHRIMTPDVDVMGRAAILNGAICRSQKYKNDQKMRCLQDCTLYLQALKAGCTLLTRNTSDFDFCLQMLPKGRVLFYSIDE